MTRRNQTIASQIYPHLPSVEAEPRQRQHGPLASMMYPSLSREAKAQEAWQARAQAEQKARSKRMAEHLRAITEQLRAEKRGR